MCKERIASVENVGDSVLLMFPEFNFGIHTAKRNMATIVLTGMGAAAVMANTAIATAGDIPQMAEAFKKAIEAGRQAYLSGLGRVIEKGASASSPLTGFLEN